MEIAKVNGVELEYEAVGSGEPVLLISPVLADGFLPLVAEPALAGAYCGYFPDPRAPAQWEL